MKRRTDPEIAAVVRDLADVFADRILERLAECTASAPEAQKWATAKSNPLGSGFAFLKAGRAGHFEMVKRGRERVARWDEVEAYLRSKKVEPRAPRTPRTAPRLSPAEEAGRQLRAAGLLPKENAA